MTRTEAKRVARYLRDHGHWGIYIVEAFDTGELTVTSYNRASSTRRYNSLDEAKQDNER